MGTYKLEAPPNLTTTEIPRQTTLHRTLEKWRPKVRKQTLVVAETHGKRDQM